MNTRDQFGNYLLLKKLTEDVLGETFRAGRLGKQGVERVALLRIFNGQGLDGERLAQRIQQRAPLQAALKSPNLAQGIDLGQVRGVPYVAYDYVSGKSLVQLQAAHLTAAPLQLHLAGRGEEVERLEALLLRCLARLPEERVQSAREMREALAALHDPAAWTRADAERFWSMAGPAMTRSPTTTWAVRSPHSELLDGATRLAPDRSAR